MTKVGTRDGATTPVDEGRDTTASVAQGDLDALVTAVASRFMDATAATIRTAFGDALQAMTEVFGVDTSFLRHNDRPRGLSVLVAEWPPRPVIPDPDPLGEVPFDVDPVFGATLELAEPYVIRPTDSPDAYQERVRTGSGIDEVSMAMVPLVRNGTTTGVLGFIKFGDRPWSTRELQALQAIASLIVQLQARVQAEERLQFNAYHDQLTGLHNRRAFMEEIEARLAGDGAPTLMFLDLDRFKSVNGYLGHGSGDALLVEEGRRLRELARPGDFVARLGGDEFVLLFDGLDDDAAALAMGERVLAAVREPIAIEDHGVTRTGSLGIATAGPRTSTGEELLRDADAAMRRAKAEGGDRLRLFDDAVRRVEDDRASTEMRLREALDTGQLVLHYQPEVDLRTGEVTAVEALLRWDQPGRGPVAAAEFIRVAEETGLIVDLGRWVLDAACRQMAAWRRALPDRDVTVRVNLSPAQLSTENLVEVVARCLRANDVPGRLLCFEITEHAVMQDVQQATDTLHALRALGVTLALDDFGTGFSSMAQLKRLPLDILKIDRTFVTGLPTDAGDRAIVDTAVRLGRAFGLEVVAEGIETAEVLEQLVQLGCRRGQGYLLMRPSPVEVVEEVLRRGRVELPGPGGGR